MAHPSVTMITKIKTDKSGCNEKINCDNKPVEKSLVISGTGTSCKTIDMFANQSTGKISRLKHFDTYMTYKPFDMKNVSIIHLIFLSLIFEMN